MGAAIDQTRALLVRAVAEAIESVVTPAVREEILAAALDIGGLTELPHAPSDLGSFVEGPLHMALCHFLDDDTADIVLGPLLHISSMAAGLSRPVTPHPVTPRPVSVPASLELEESGVAHRRVFETGEVQKESSGERFRPRGPEGFKPSSPGRSVYETGERLRQRPEDRSTPPAPEPEPSNTTVFVVSQHRRAQQVMDRLRDHVRVMHVTDVTQVLTVLDSNPLMEAILILDGALVVSEPERIAASLRTLMRPLFVAVWNQNGQDEWELEGVCARERWAYLPPAEGVHEVVGFVRTMAS